MKKIARKENYIPWGKTFILLLLIDRWIVSEWPSNGFCPVNNSSHSNHIIDGRILSEWGSNRLCLDK